MSTDSWLSSNLKSTSFPISTLNTKLNKIIKLGKDVLKKSEMSNVVYKLECISCDKTYVGQTKRLLNIRREEYKNNFNLKNEKYHNVITKHRTWVSKIKIAILVYIKKFTNN